jgi:integrase
MSSAARASNSRIAIFAAAPTSEVLGATWGELDVEDKVWTVPAKRMKADTKHRVPLSQASLSLLEQVR